MFLKRPKSFQARLFFVFTIGTTLVTVVIATIFFFREQQSFYKSTEERAHLLATIMATDLRIPLFSGDQSEIKQLAENMANQPDVVGITITGRNGKVLFNSAAQTNIVKTIRHKRAIMPRGGISDDDSLGSDQTNAPLGEVAIFLSTHGLQQKTNSMLIGTATLALIFWLAVLSISYAVLKSLTASQRLLMEGLAAMRAANFDIQLQVTSNDDLGDAIQAVNELALTLRQREESIRQLHEDLLHAKQIEFETEKKKDMAKLIQANRMTSLGLLVSSMAHEINNPVSTILLDSGFLKNMLPDIIATIEQSEIDLQEVTISGLPFDKARVELLAAGDNILASVRRIESVVKDLRAYSLGAGTSFISDLDINRVITGAKTIIRAQGRYGNATISENLAQGLPLVTGSRHQLEQVVVNLILNSLQAMPPEGGLVEIITSFDPESRNALITVRDNGEGIPPENLSKLFEPFFSTHKEQGGSGLGLYISSYIINEHRGQLTFESSPGGGTTAHLCLPATTIPNI